MQRVFIMDDAEQFLPLYLRFVKGVVDSADLPLNVSRELLQRNPELDAMRGALTRRALDMLGKLSAGDAEKYASFWTEFGQTIKEGLIEDQAKHGQAIKAAAICDHEIGVGGAGPVAGRLPVAHGRGAGQNLLICSAKVLRDGQVEPAP